jgi:hypothetical protein
MERTISSLIASAEGGDRRAAADALAASLPELRRMAGRQLSRGPSDLTLGTTTLLHEAYLDIGPSAPRSRPRALHGLRRA